MTDTERAEGRRETTDVAREEADRIRQSARDEAGRVAEEAKQQGRHLYEQATTRAKEEARHQTDRAAEGLRTISSDLRSLAEDGETETPLASWMQQGADRLDEFASQVSERGFEGVMEDVKGYARRNPGTFLAITFGAGVLAGRMVRNMNAPETQQARGISSYNTGTRLTQGEMAPERGSPSLSQPGPGSTRPGGAE